jgi:hypothetical protein
VNPAARLSMALLGGLALWLPSLSATLRGALDPSAAAVRYLAAFAFAYAAVWLLSRLVVAYATQQAREHTQAEPRRRVEDLVEG